MSRLTRFTVYTENGIKIGVITLATLIVILLAFLIVSAISKENNLSLKNGIASNALGDVPPIIFTHYVPLPQGDNPIYTLATPTNSFIKVPKIMTVYRLSSPSISVNSLNVATAIAQQLQFSGQGQQKSQFLYDWYSTNHIFEINIQNFNFQIQLKNNPSGYFAYQQKQGNTLDNFQDPLSVLQTVSSFLTSLYYTNSLGQTVYILPELNRYQSEGNNYKITNNFTKTPVTITDTNILDSNVSGTLSNGYYVFYKKTIAGYPIYNPDPNLPLIRFLIDDPIQGVSGIISAYFTNYNIQRTSTGTYDIISPQQAFAKMERGQGALSSLYSSSGNPYLTVEPSLDVTRFYVNSVTLGYYEGQNYHQFLEPIYVFSGIAYFKNGSTGTFYYYVNALP